MNTLAVNTPVNTLATTPGNTLENALVLLVTTSARTLVNTLVVNTPVNALVDTPRNT